MADIVKGLRDAIQDLLVPELKAVQAELKHLKEAQQETNHRLEGIEKSLEDLEKSFEGMKVELRHFKEAQQETNKKLDGMQDEMGDLKLGQREILAKLDLDKRVSRIEVLLEELRKQKAAN